MLGLLSLCCSICLRTASRCVSGGSVNTCPVDLPQSLALGVKSCVVTQHEESRSDYMLLFLC